jgi:hypothetical protein
MRNLVNDEYHSVTIDPEGSIVTIKRKSTPFPTVVECNRVYTDLVRRLQTLDRAKLNLLIDLRDVAPRNDPAYERIIGVHRKKIYNFFSKKALVVKTAAGVLQVSRHARDDGIDVVVFMDEVEARRYLLGESARTE